MSSLVRLRRNMSVGSLWGSSGRLSILCRARGSVDSSLFLLFRSPTCQNEACCRDFGTLAIYLVLTFSFFKAQLCSPVADMSVVIYFFRAIMEHKELLRVQWDWQIGKTVLYTWFLILVGSHNKMFILHYYTGKIHWTCFAS